MKKILIVGAGNFCGIYSKNDVNSKVIYLDKIALPRINVVHDLNSFPYPFKDSEFDEVCAEHVLEHLDNVVRVIEELWRITKPDGIMKIIVPAWNAWQAYTDPTHKHFFTRESFDFWDSTTSIGKERGYYIAQKCKIKVEEKKIRFFDKSFLSILQPLFNKYYNFYKKYLAWIFSANDIYFVLRILKNE